MVKKFSKISIIILLITLCILTIYKLNKKHEETLYHVLYSDIEYRAKRCFLEGNCEEKITLNELYEKKYLSVQYDPISKEEIDKKLEIIIKDDKVEIKNKK